MEFVFVMMDTTVHTVSFGPENAMTCVMVALALQQVIVNIVLLTHLKNSMPVFVMKVGQVPIAWTILDTTMEVTTVVMPVVTAVEAKAPIHAFFVYPMLILIPVVSVYVMNTGEEQTVQLMIIMVSQLIILVMEMSQF